MTNLPVTQGGPRITVKASCFDCPFVVSESYRVQSDSGSNVYCAHPSFEKRQRVGDTVWDTPDFCPVADIPAIRARVQSHSLPGDDLVEEGYKDGYEFFRNKWIGDQEEMIADMVRCFVPRPLPGDVGTLRAVDAFEMGFSFGMAMRGQTLEDSRAVGRLLTSDTFKAIAPQIEKATKEQGFDSFQDADSGICQAKRVIRAALTPSPCPGDGMREAADEIASIITPGNFWHARTIGDLTGWCDRLQTRIRALAALTPSALTGDAPPTDPDLERHIFAWFNDRDCDEMRACLEAYDFRQGAGEP